MKASVVADQQITFIDQKMRENDELTAAVIKQKHRV
jgi:hypothetical protein